MSAVADDGHGPHAQSTPGGSLLEAMNPMLKLLSGKLQGLIYTALNSTYGGCQQYRKTMRPPFSSITNAVLKTLYAYVINARCARLLMPFIRCPVELILLLNKTPSEAETLYS
jgi:hypothetical protein